MKILVLAGGLSPERDVSMASSCLIANALLDAGYKVSVVDVFEGVKQAHEQTFINDPSKRYHFKVPEKEPDLITLRAKYPGKSLIGDGVQELCKQADVVFLGLHGGMGENGQIQAMLDILGVSYTGLGYAACLLAMNKQITKRLLAAEGINVPNGVVLKTGDNIPDISFPCFVKPVSGGSSIGTSRADTRVCLETAIKAARYYEESVLIERMVCGREFSVGVLDGVPLPPIEIIPSEGFYDYTNKYQAGMTTEICPADLTAEQTKTIQEITLRVFNTLGLRDYARVDFILDEKTGQFICLEANTLPGMTPTSLLPQEAQAAGIGYIELCRRIVGLALAH